MQAVTTSLPGDELVAAEEFLPECNFATRIAARPRTTRTSWPQAPVIASASQATPNEGETGTHQAQTIAGLSDQGMTPPQTDPSGDETAAKPALEGPPVSATPEPSSGSDGTPSTTPLGDRFSRWIQDQLHERQIHSRGLSPTLRTLGFEAIAALLDSRTLSLDRSFDR